MINWYDVQIEMEIAQERYQSLIQARQIERILASGQPKSSIYQSILIWLGQQLINWGHRFQNASLSAPDQRVQSC